MEGAPLIRFFFFGETVLTPLEKNRLSNSGMPLPHYPVLVCLTTYSPEVVPP
jgi:hypothetical protein